MEHKIGWGEKGWGTLESWAKANGGYNIVTLEKLSWWQRGYESGSLLGWGWPSVEAQEQELKGTKMFQCWATTGTHRRGWPSWDRSAPTCLGALRLRRLSLRSLLLQPNSSTEEGGEAGKHTLGLSLCSLHCTLHIEPSVLPPTPPPSKDCPCLVNPTSNTQRRKKDVSSFMEEDSY